MTPEVSRRIAAILGRNFVYPAERELIIGSAMAATQWEDIPQKTRDLLEEISKRGAAEPTP